MSTDVAVIPHTGEQVDLAAPTPQLGEWHDQLKELVSQINSLRGDIDAEIIDRLRKNLTWTLHEEGLTIEAKQSGPTMEWNIAALRATLADLMDEGVIEEDAVDRTIEPVTTWKVKAPAIKALCAISEDVKDRIESCGTKLDPPRRVSVKRA